MVLFNKRFCKKYEIRAKNYEPLPFFVCLFVLFFCYLREDKLYKKSYKREEKETDLIKTYHILLAKISSIGSQIPLMACYSFSIFYGVDHESNSPKPRCICRNFSRIPLAGLPYCLFL